MEHYSEHDRTDGLREPVRLTSDFVFKYVFGGETSTSILRAFLTAVQTDAGLPAVAEVEIRNPFNLSDSAEAKTSVVDVRARDVKGTIYTIEVQALPEAAFRERALYYIDERGETDAMEDDILLQILKEDPDIEDAEQRYRQFVADDELRERYQDRIKAERDRRSQLIYAQRQGETLGREKGRDEGLSEGRAEIVRRMKERDIPVEEIVELTGLSAAEISGIV